MTKKPEYNLDDVLEKVSQETALTEKSELREVFDNLDHDVENDKRMSPLDFNTRLSSVEISNCMRCDEIRNIGILPASSNLTRAKKRLSVSLKGLGRVEKTTIASAKQDATLSGRSMGARLLSRRGE